MTFWNCDFASSIIALERGLIHVDTTVSIVLYLIFVEYICWKYPVCNSLWIWIWILVFNATFSNISAISWRPALVVEEVPGENHRLWEATGKLYHFANPCRIGDTLVWTVRSNDLTHWATRAPNSLSNLWVFYFFYL